MVRRWTAALGAVLLGSCGMTPEEEACNDTVDAMVELVVRCGSQAEADAFREQIMASFRNCEVKAIRDEKQLREECIPAIGKVSCQTVKEGKDWLPESCKSQLLF